MTVEKWRETISLYQSYSQSIMRMKRGGLGDSNTCKQLSMELNAIYNECEASTTNCNSSRNKSIQEMCKEARIDHSEFERDMIDFFGNDIMNKIEMQLNALH